MSWWEPPLATSFSFTRTDWSHSAPLRTRTWGWQCAIGIRSSERVRSSSLRGRLRPTVLPIAFGFGDCRVDIIPFGGVERRDRNIAWPPEGDEVMNVSGFAEALATAISVRLPGGVPVDVASLPAMALLKTWAWQDRKYTAPGKDAADLWEFLRYYGDAGNQDRLYGSEGEAALASFEFDVEKAGAWLLGRDACEVLSHGPGPRTALDALDVILRRETDPDGSLHLVAQMPGGNRDRQISLLAAFRVGLLEEPLPDSRA